MGPAATMVRAQVNAALARSNAVYQDALIMLAAEMQKPIDKGGNMPVATGFLRSSLHASITGEVPSLQKNPGGEHYTYNAEETNAILRRATIRKYQVTLVYRAEYAIFQEYKHKFKALAVQRWPLIVQAATNLRRVV